MSSIKISKKHGVNPCIPICCWCGKEREEIALLGKLKGDVEAPKHAILDYEPCDECKKKFMLGVVLIEVILTEPADGRPPISEDNGNPVYPTFKWSVLKTDTAKRIFCNDHLKDSSKLLLDEEIYSRLVEGAEKNE